MTTSFARVLLAALLTMGIGGCQAGPTNASPTISTAKPTSTIAVLPTTSRTETRQTQPPVMTPTKATPPAAADKRIVASIDPGGAPWTMAAADGYLWVIAGNSILRIDTQTDQVVGKPIPVAVPENAALEAIAVSEDALWVSIVGWGNILASHEIDSVLRIDPQTGETLATVKVRRGPVSLALTPGLVWLVNWDVHLISRIDSKANQLAGEPLKARRGPYSMAVGDGSVWVVNHDEGTLTRIDPGMGLFLADIPLPWEPHRVAFGEGAVWVGNWHDLSVTRIDPRSNQVVGHPIPIGYAAGNIAAGGGNVWVTSDYRGVQAFPEPYPDHTVLVQIDPMTNQVVDTIPLGGHPVDVEVTGDAVWVSIQNPDRILKIQP